MTKSNKYPIETTYDLPIPYKELLFYPVCIDRYYEFFSYSRCFFLEKNSIPDVRVIQMSYLEYMFEVSVKDGQMHVALFKELLAICLRKERNCIDLSYNKKMKPIFTIDGINYDKDDFNEIKDIICEQNLLELPDESIQKEIREKMEEAKRLKNRLEGNHGVGSLEDLIVAIVMSTGLSFVDVKNMTIRKFNKILQRLDNKIHYEIYLSASMSGLVEFKDKSFIKHWLSNLDEDDVNKDLKVDYDAIKSKIEFSDKKN